jgi:signal recognition particle GTPase
LLEKDFPKVITIQRIIRIARGSGRPIREVQELLAQHKQFEKVVEKMKGILLSYSYFDFRFVYSYIFAFLDTCFHR